MTSTAMVTIGCKLPNGLTLELINPAPQKQGLLPGPRGQRYTLNGANTVRIARTNPADPGFGETQVPEDFWTEWLKRNRDLDAVRKGFVFVAKSAEQFKAEAADRIKERTALEPLNPELVNGKPVDTRMQGGVSANPEGGALKGTDDRLAPTPVA